MTIVIGIDSYTDTLITGYTKLLVALGGDEVLENEVLDLADPSKQCTWQAFAQIREDGDGGLLNGRRPIFCGGRNDNDGVFATCRGLLFWERIPFNGVKEITARNFYWKLILNDHTMWITGGKDENGEKLDSTEFIRVSK